MKLKRQYSWVLGLMLACSTVPGGPAKLRVEDAGLADALQAQGAAVIADYGSYRILEADRVPIEAAGLEVSPESYMVQLKGRSLDTRKSEIRSLTRPVGAFAGKRLHLIQFAGPVKAEWISDLKGLGVEVVNYLPQNAYLVYGNAAALSRLQDWSRRSRFVQWDGAYAAEYRVQPTPGISSRNRGAMAFGGELFAVQLIEDPAANPSTLNLIRQLSLAPVRADFRILHFRNVIVRMDAAKLPILAGRPDVVYIQPYVTPQRLDERQDQIVAGNLSGSGPSGAGYLAWLASKGFSQTQFWSSDFVVDLTDSGVDTGTNLPGHFGLYAFGDPGSSNRVAYQRLQGTPSSGSTLEGCDGHGTLNAHIIAGYSDFSGFPYTDSAGYAYGLGVCPFVRIGSSVIFDPDYTYPDFADMQSEAYEDGARISNNSWGTAGTAGAYDLQAQAYDALVRDAQPDGATCPASGNQEMVIIFAAGNEGGTTRVASPGTAKNVITVGASENVRSLAPASGGNDPDGSDGCGHVDTEADNVNDMATYSSRGPCADGRKKPDLVAPGTHITGGVAQNTPAATNGIGSALDCFDAAHISALPGAGQCDLPTPGLTNNFFPLGQEFYSVSSGTSHSAPAVAGACALLRQYFINNELTPPSAAMTKAWLINSARHLTGAGANDNLWSPAQGMGAVHLGNAFDGVSRMLRDQAAADTFTNSGQIRVYTGTISNTNKPFRVTLAWTDAPGSPNAAKELANDLDLSVTIGGVTYKGNVFSNALSIAGGSVDQLNNVESVFLPAGVSGNFVVIVTGANINSDGVPNVEPALDQDFALVIYNATETWVPVMRLESATILAENCGAGNGAVDPGESVTVGFALKNIGTADTTNVVATLQQSNGVAYPSGAQVYGPILAGGSGVTQAFSFTAGGVCGEFIGPVLRLQDGVMNLGDLNSSLRLGLLTMATNDAANSGSIAVPQSGTAGPGSPYPSTISVSGITNEVTRVTVKVEGLSHTYPHDLHLLLVGPVGTNAYATNVMLMSNCSVYSVTNATFIFDDAAAAMLPDSGPYTSGTFKPSGYDSDAESLPPPAPGWPFGAALSVFTSRDPNGIWSLYVNDKSSPDTGSIAMGWELSIVTSNLTCCAGAVPPRPLIQSVSLSNTVASVRWSAVPQSSYRLQYVTNLSNSNWIDIVPDVLATNFSATASSGSNSAPSRFFRIKALY